MVSPRVGRYRIAYVSRLVLPNHSANSLQTIQMAAALSRQTKDTSLFVHQLRVSGERILNHYGLEATALRIRSLHTSSWPELLYGNARTRFLLYNSAVAGILGFRKPNGCKNVLFVRSRLEFLYWGLLRPYLFWMRNWYFVYECHQLPAKKQPDGAWLQPRAAKRARKALGNYDLILTVTRGLADDLTPLLPGDPSPVVLPLTSSLHRSSPARSPEFSDRSITLGFVGSMDPDDGLDDVFEGLRKLPTKYRLRLVGPVKERHRDWFEKWLAHRSMQGRVRALPPIGYSRVAEAIDRCDILLAPAGKGIYSGQHRSPMKLFDYMARAKPIIAADVESHRSILEDGRNALLYRPGNAEILAAAVLRLVAYPSLAEFIARQAWLDSKQHTYEQRARKILQLFEVLERNKRGRAGQDGNVRIAHA